MSGSLEKTTTSAEGTEALGEAFAPALEAGDVVALSGPLAAGKTRFAQGVARGLQPGQRARSPSFTLVNEYPGRVRLFHVDLYRLESARDVEGLGLGEYAEQGALLVEWGERLGAHWLEDALVLAFTPLEGDARRIVASGPASRPGGSERGRALLEAWRALPEAW